MSRLAIAWAAGAVFASIGLFFARAIVPSRHDLELDVYVLALGGMAVLAVMSWLREAVPTEGESRLEQALEPDPPESPRIAELDRLERQLSMGASTAFDLDHRLRPVIREIAAGRLERRGLRLDSGSPAVQAAVGEELWEIVRPDREASQDRRAPGPGIEALRELVGTLERL